MLIHAETLSMPCRATCPQFSCHALACTETTSVRTGDRELDLTTANVSLWLPVAGVVIRDVHRLALIALLTRALSLFRLSVCMRCCLPLPRATQTPQTAKAAYGMTYDMSPLFALCSAPPS